jgi:tetratricopeptide (TPR) repeat protein
MVRPVQRVNPRMTLTSTLRRNVKVRVNIETNTRGDRSFNSSKIGNSAMKFSAPARQFTLLVVPLAMVLLCASFSHAQTVDIVNGETDPIKLFERGQNAHAKGDLEHAIELYEAAIKLRPEFPEAEYQLGTALVALNRLSEAEKELKRAIELRKDWPLPYAALGNVLVRENNDKEAEPILRRAIELGAKDYFTLDLLAAVRLRANDKPDALALAKQATRDDSPASAWALRAFIENESGDKVAAAASVERALSLDEKNVSALETRAELRAANSDFDHAIQDLKTALSHRAGDKEISLRLAKFYELNNQIEEAQRIYQAFGQKLDESNRQQSASNGTVGVVASPEEIAAANSEDPKIARPALEKLIARNPKNAGLLAKLGELLRTIDPQKSLESFANANRIDPANPAYATGYAAALIQARRFAEAIPILKQVIANSADDYPAHANLALALHELKRYQEALPQWEWMASARPNVAATYFYIAISHDNLREYQPALDAYEKFLTRADATRNQLEIEKVNLRLPQLRDQIKRGQGVKPPKSKA